VERIYENRSILSLEWKRAVVMYGESDDDVSWSVILVSLSEWAKNRTISKICYRCT